MRNESGEWVSTGVRFESDDALVQLSEFAGNEIKIVAKKNLNDLEASVSNGFELFQNYPNPFNPSTKISFDLPQSSYATLAIHNSIGQEITVLIDRDLQPGKYEFNFDASSLPSGIYFYTLSSAGFRKTGKMMLIR